MTFLSFNSFKAPFPSIKRVVRGKMSVVEAKVSGKLETIGNISAPLKFSCSAFKTFMIGKSVSVVKKRTKLNVIGNNANPIIFKAFIPPQEFGNVSFVRPKPLIIPVMSGKIEKLKTQSLQPYTPKEAHVILTEKPVVGGVSGEFNLEFSMLRNETRTFKLPFKFLQTLENDNGGSVSGEYLTFTPEEIGEYDFIGQGGQIRIKVSPALVMKDSILNIGKS